MRISDYSGGGNMQDNGSNSTGRQVWAVAAIIFSVLVLLLAATGIVGTWVGRSAAIRVNDNLMDVVDRLAGTGLEGISRLGEGIDEINSFVVEVEAAVNELAESVSEKGVIMTLLPPEKEEKVISKADEIGATVESIVSAVESALDLYQTVDDIPFVNLPKPSEADVGTLESSVQEIQDSVAQLATDIQDFRDGAASEVGRISEAAGEVSGRLEETSQNLSDLNSELADLQIRAEEWKSSFRTYSAVAAVVVTLVLLWIIYAMVVLIMKFWAELKILHH
jgi:methyl-accepting chemotaxis protein